MKYIFTEKLINLRQCFSDILERNLIESCIEWDNRELLTKCGPRTHLNSIVNAFNQCGVSFSVWRKNDEENKKTGCYDWTSMVGNAKKKVLAKLPEKMNEDLIGKNYLTVKKIWEVRNWCLEIFLKKTHNLICMFVSF